MINERGERGATSGKGRVFRFDPVVEFIGDRQSALEADEKACKLIESGVQTLLGPTDGASIAHVQSICDNLEVPYFELRPLIGSSPSLASPLGGGPQPRRQSEAPQVFLAQQSAARRTNGGDAFRAPSDKLGGHEFVAYSGPGAPSDQAFSDNNTVPSARDSAGPSINGRADKPTGALPEQTATKWQAQAASDDLTVNLYPPAYLLNSAYIDLIYAWNWSSFAIVYEDGNSMIKLQDLFKESTAGSWTNRWQIKLFQFEPRHRTRPARDEPSLAGAHTLAGPALPASADKGARPEQLATRAPSTRFGSFRDIFWRIKSLGEQNILLDIRTENLYEALKQAQQVGCMTESFSYLITSLDLHTIDLEDFKYSRTRISAFSLLQVTTSRRHAAHDKTSPSAEGDGRAAGPTMGGAGEDEGRPGRLLERRQDRLFDEGYLEKLGVHVTQDSLLMSKLAGHRSGSQARTEPNKGGTNNNNNNNGNGWSQTRPMNTNLRYNKHRLSPSVVLERQGAYMDPPNEVFARDWSRREMLLSSPASMGLLPSLDRDNEQRLFEFFLEQQERNPSHLRRISTSSAILHDSLLLFAMAFQELGPAAGELQLPSTPLELARVQQTQPSIPQDLSTSTGPLSWLGSWADHNSSALLAQDKSATDEPTIGCSLNTQLAFLGSSLVNYMRLSSFVGLTGPVSFDERGLRADFKLDMLGMAPNIGLVKVGEWRSLSRPAKAAGSEGRGGPGEPETAEEGDQVRNYDELSKSYELELARYQQMLANNQRVQVPYSKAIPSARSELGARPVGDGAEASLMVNGIIFDRLYGEQADPVDTLIVTTKLSQPYFMLKETPNKLEGNDQYEGFAVDLIHELSRLVNFKYRWREVADKKYGSKETLANGSVVWNGMIGEIIRGKADLAIVDLTITAQREEAVDFTLPFMNTGISILFKKPTTKVTTLFSFLSPFSSDVWAYVLAAYCGISAVLFLVGHLSPYEWSDPHPCSHSNGAEHEREPLRNQFSLLNSFWFTIGSLMQQGSDLTPRSMSTRTIAGIWYFFTLIMISSYTANLAAFLTVEKVVYPIENVRDLSNQQEIRYGCVESGSTCVFFQDSQIDTYRRINENMRKFRTYVRSNDHGQRLVEEGKFAFFMESTSIEYIVERNCNLTQIGGLLDSKGYGLATSKKSRFKRPYRTLLSEGILHLQETGMLHVLKNRWWKERRGGGTCTDDQKGGGVTELSLANVGGVFVVLLGGLAISFLVAITEFMWRAHRSGSKRDHICEQMMSDLRFALACKRSTKPVAEALRSRPPPANKPTAAAPAKARPQQPPALRRHKAIELADEPDWQQKRHLTVGYQMAAVHQDQARRRTQPSAHLRSGAPSAGQTKPDPIMLHRMLTLTAQQPCKLEPALLLQPGQLADYQREPVRPGKAWRQPARFVSLDELGLAANERPVATLACERDQGRARSRELAQTRADHERARSVGRRRMLTLAGL